MVELVLAALLVFVFRGRFDVPPDAFIPATLAAWAPIYLTSCLLLPHSRCPNPRCSKKKPVHGNRKRYRRRRPCRLCGGADWHRVGARVMRRG